ncbi:hypothetical protein Rhe02_19490 [Rhizocola hellebori]|uniref:Uncharacterized protein n=1 Tax=Rhizocola hellebori TaxID=1392758 RepID=A0A8J3VF84_9ACTN|nr:hypothetical protein [Rhizocola hellebori]GIH03882.1 hypothetical protein Rhe02_19490 [Rhizocola hellebori]
MVTVAQDLAARAAPLEYWFYKVHSGDLAFLVDFIVRRAIEQAEVRVSLWVRGQGRVARTLTPRWSVDAEVAMADCTLDAATSAGVVEDIEWNLTYEPRSGRAAPAVPLLSRLHPFDLELVSRPRVDFRGHVTVAGERFDIANGYGCLTHYWGRRLPDRWHWISASGFGKSDLAVEASVFRSRLWGKRPGISAGYLWTMRDGRENTVISPWNGLITIKGGLTDYQLVARRPGGTTRLQCLAQPGDYNDLGEGIRQTLLGSCTVIDVGAVDLRAGLEYRIT